jgi:hypothetical protein
MEIKNNNQKTSLSFQYGVRAPCYSTTFPGKSINYETGSLAQEVIMLFDRKIDLFLLNMHDVFNLQKLSLSYYFEYTRGNTHSPGERWHQKFLHYGRSLK